MTNSRKLIEFDSANNHYGHSITWGRTCNGMKISPESAASIFNNMAPNLVGRISLNDGSAEEVRLLDADSSTQT